MMFINLNPLDPAYLWNRYAVSMLEDHFHTVNEEERFLPWAINMALQHIEDILQNQTRLWIILIFQPWILICWRNWAHKSISLFPHERTILVPC
jgi:hypothetical protein